MEGEGQPPPYAPGYAAPGNAVPVVATGTQVQVAVPLQLVPVQVQTGTAASTTAPTVTQTGPYNHRQYGTFYRWYYLLLAMVGAIFLIMIINMIRFEIGIGSLLFPLIWMILVMVLFISSAMSCKYLEVRDEGNRLIIEFGPCQSPIFCGMTTSTIAYNDIAEFAPVEPGCMAHSVRFVNYDKQKGIKFMMQGDMCDFCSGNEIYQITLRSSRCQYSKVRFTSDDGPALMAALRAKGVNVSDRAIRPCCCY